MEFGEPRRRHRVPALAERDAACSAHSTPLDIFMSAPYPFRIRNVRDRTWMENIRATGSLHDAYRRAAAVALFVAAANLRPAIAAVSPLVDRIQTDLDLSATGWRC